MEEDTLGFDPEGCDACGCPAGDFGEEDLQDGCWKCPECGHVE